MLIYLKEIFVDNGKRYDPNKNYCMDCGACCTYFKIYFPKKESSEFGGQVPKEMVEKYDRTRINMKGRHLFRGTPCVALTGEIGKNVSCSIYENRPNVCREFEVISKDGKQNPRCMRARREFGLKPELEE